MNIELSECCVVCLEKKSGMINLKESTEELGKLSTLSHVEFSNYMEYAHQLCISCDEKLVSSHSFLQQVLKSIQILDGVNIKIETTALKAEATGVIFEDAPRQMKSVDDPKVDEVDPLDDSHLNLRKTKTSSIKLVPIEEVNNAIEIFRKERRKSDNCLICGFTVSQRKYLIKHMTGHHKDQVPEWCRECNGLYQNMDEHRKTHNNKISCNFCWRMIRANSYVEHVMCHAGAFKCDMCGNIFNSSSSLKKHKFLHTNYRPYQCPNCVKGFLQACALKCHLINIHGKFKCDNCMKHFIDKDKLLNHKCVTTDVNINIELQNESSSDLNESPNKSKEVIEKIPECNYNSEDSESLKDTEENFDDVAENFQDDFKEYCEKCDKKVTSLEKHVANYHAKLMCDICQKEFSSSYKLQLHIQIHKGTAPRECQFCQKKFTHKVKHLDHERTHTKEKPHKCKFCEKSFTQTSVLKTHMRQHTGRPEVCDICGKRFCRKSELRLHLRKHTGERPYLCSVCGKSYGQKSHLNQHMISHREDRPHQCPLCEKAFKTNQLLKGHVQLHSGDKPFQCSHCSYTCYRQYRLKEHMRVHAGRITCISETVNEDISSHS